MRKRRGLSFGARLGAAAIVLVVAGHVALLLFMLSGLPWWGMLIAGLGIAWMVRWFWRLPVPERGGGRGADGDGGAGLAFAGDGAGSDSGSSDGGSCDGGGGDGGGSGDGGGACD